MNSRRKDAFEERTNKIEKERAYYDEIHREKISHTTTHTSSSSSKKFPFLTPNSQNLKKNLEDITMEDGQELFVNAKYHKERKENTNPLSSPCFDYKYSKIACPYRTEFFHSSKTENDVVKSLVSRATEKDEKTSQQTASKTEEDEKTSQQSSKKARKKIIIDTDIGTDCDDVLALLMALRMKDVEIIGVTTNYYPTKLRALVAETMIKASGQNIPVIPGCDYVCGT